jgi:hypothetical protein
MPRRELARHLPGAVRRAPGRLGRLSPGEMVLLLQAPIALPLAALALRRYKLRRLQSILGRGPVHRAPPAAARARRVEAERLAWVVQVAAAYGPWPANCLQRSLVLWWFLRRQGLSGDLLIGVRRNPATDALDFHAWVEHDGVVINDRRDVRSRYATFDRPIVPTGADFG